MHFGSMAATSCISKDTPTSQGSRGLDSVRLDIDAEPLADGAEDRGEIVHARIALFGEHPMEALAGLVRLDGERLESYRSVHQIPQDQARSMGLAVEEQR